MKTVTKISIIALMAINMLQAEGHYEVKSAKIELKITSTQTVGSISTSETGTKRIVVGNYGKQELEELDIIIKNTTNGKTKVDKIHNIRYINGDIRYVADFNKKTMNRSTNYAGKLFGTKKYKGSVKKMLELQRMKKVGTDTVAGYKCDVWQLGKMSKTCFYKGFPLRKETTLMGMKRVIVATKAEFDIKLSDDDFRMPNFAIDGKVFSKSELEEMDNKEKKKREERKKEQDNSIILMKEAYKKAGVQEGKAPTKEQMQKARVYMQKAMFPTEKKKILEGMKSIPQAKKCFKSANSVDEANKCELMMDSEEPKLHRKWDNKVKANLLKKIDGFEKAIPCIEKADTFNTLEQCFPE